MRPSAKHLMQHRFVVRFPSNAKSDLLQLLDAFRERIRVHKLGALRSTSRNFNHPAAPDPIPEGTFFAFQASEKSL